MSKSEASLALCNLISRGMSMTEAKKRIAESAPAEPTASTQTNVEGGEPVDYSQFTKAKLSEQIAERGLTEPTGDPKKDDLIALLVAADQAVTPDNSELL